MSLSIQMRAESAVLYVIATGSFSLKGALDRFVEMLEEVDRNQSRKVLADGRTVTGNPRTIERFLYGEFAANAVSRYMVEGVLRHAPQFAYVLHEPVLDPSRFAETVAVNRGMWIKAFDNMQDARSWLGLSATADAGEP